MPSAAHLTVSLYLCSSGSNTRDGDQGVAGRNGTGKYFPDEGSLICPPGKSMILYKKETEKIELVARPGVYVNGASAGRREIIIRLKVIKSELRFPLQETTALRFLEVYCISVRFFCLK